MGTACPAAEGLANCGIPPSRVPGLAFRVGVVLVARAAPPFSAGEKVPARIRVGVVAGLTPWPPIAVFITPGARFPPGLTDAVLGELEEGASGETCASNSPALSPKSALEEDAGTPRLYADGGVLVLPPARAGSKVEVALLSRLRKLVKDAPEVEPRNEAANGSSGSFVITVREGRLVFWPALGTSVLEPELESLRPPAAATTAARRLSDSASFSSVPTPKVCPENRVTLSMTGVFSAELLHVADGLFVRYAESVKHDSRLAASSTLTSSRAGS